MGILHAAAGIGALLVSVGLVTHASAQDAVPPHILLQQVTRPGDVPPSGASTLDVRDAPVPPPIDTISNAIHITVVVGDPRCFPGEDLVDDPASIRARQRRPAGAR